MYIFLKKQNTISIFLFLLSWSPVKIHHCFKLNYCILQCKAMGEHYTGVHYAEWNMFTCAHGTCFKINKKDQKSPLFVQRFCTLFVDDCAGLTGDEVVITEELKLKVGSEELVMGREIFGNTGTSISWNTVSFIMIWFIFYVILLSVLVLR